MATPKRETRTEERRGRQERVYGMSIGSAIHYYRRNLGLSSHGALADAAARHLPEYVGMNRRLIQGIEAGEYTLGNGVNELQMIAIARALMIPPTWLEIDRSADIKRLESLIRTMSWPDGPGDGNDLDPESAPIPFNRRASDRSDQREPDSRCFSAYAGQAA